MYWENLQIAKNHAYEADWVVGKVVKEDFDISATQTTVDWEKFCTWAQGVQLHGLPTEIEILGGADFSTTTCDDRTISQPAPSNHPKKNQSNGLRRDILTSAFESAWAHVNYKTEWHPIWVHLCKLADDGTPPFVECVDDTIKYKDAGEVKILTKDAARGRVRRLVGNKK